jgi:hypothetical protein
MSASNFKVDIYIHKTAQPPINKIAEQCMVAYDAQSQPASQRRAAQRPCPSYRKKINNINYKITS